MQTASNHSWLHTVQSKQTTAAVAFQPDEKYGQHVYNETTGFLSGLVASISQLALALQEVTLIDTEVNTKTGSNHKRYFAVSTKSTRAMTINLVASCWSAGQDPFCKQTTTHLANVQLGGTTT